MLPQVRFKPYAPVEYTAPFVLKCPPWADKPDVSEVEFNILDVKARIDRCSFEGDYAIDRRNNRPMWVCLALRSCCDAYHEGACVCGGKRAGFSAVSWCRGVRGCPFGQCRSCEPTLLRDPETPGGVLE